MDPNEIIKATAEVGKVAAASIPFTAIVKRMLGPAADEVAESWRDQARLYRYGRSLDMLKKAEKMAHQAGFATGAVPIKLLFPLLEAASFEEEEDMHTMWAALFVNAASLENAEKVRPGFIAVLRQMAPDEAALLKWIYDKTATLNQIDYFQVCEAQVDLGWLKATDCSWQQAGLRGLTMSSRLATCLDSLEAEKLVRRAYLQGVPGEASVYRMEEPIAFRFEMTNRGREFVEACQPPKPRS